MKKLIFLADLYAKDYIGGAELTTEALIEDCNKDVEIIKLYCSNIDAEIIQKNKDNHWIICNFSSLSTKNKLELCKNVSYSIIEYDYKICNFRSPEKHKQQENQECDCHLKEENKINLLFYGLAKKIWFMSVKQRQYFLQNVRTIKKEKTEILSSVFSKKDLSFIKSLQKNEKNNKFLIMKSNSWIKGYEQAIEYAKQHELEFDIIHNLPYQELLKKMAISRGLVFLPRGSDTCPRLVLEAQMLDCVLILNDLVQHKDEEWATNKDTCIEYLENRASFFWDWYELEQELQ